MPNLMEIAEDMEAEVDIAAVQVAAEVLAEVEVEDVDEEEVEDVDEEEVEDVDEEEEVEEAARAVILEVAKGTTHGRSLLVGSVEMKPIVSRLRSTFKALVKLLISS